MIFHALAVAFSDIDVLTYQFLVAYLNQETMAITARYKRLHRWMQKTGENINTTIPQRKNRVTEPQEPGRLSRVRSVGFVGPRGNLLGF